MSSESESSYCSTCSESNYESSLSDISLNDEDMDYMNELRDHTNRHLFYLKIVDIVTKGQTSDECEDQKTNESAITADDRSAPKRSIFTSWAFPTKPLKFKKKSFKRKSSKKKEIKDKTETKGEDNPLISVSVCDDTNNSLEINNTNKLLDLIEGKSQTIGSKIDNKFVLMYLMPPNETQTDCLLYSYPKPQTEDSDNPILLKLKGMWITLSQVVQQITNESICLSSIAVNDGNNEHIYRISFVHQLDSLLVLALPQNKFTDIEVEAIIETIARIIKFIYTSLDSAFKDESNHENVTKLLSTLEYLLSEDIKYSTIDSLFMNTIKRLLIDDNLAINLNDSLSEYEAMDWLSDDSFVDLDQQSNWQFLVIGSCLIYKGVVLSSHLSKNQLKDIYGFLSIKGLLALHKTHSLRLVYWSEVFPTSDQKKELNDYKESEDVKYFVSIVGFQHLIHSTLIEMPFHRSDETPIKPNEVIINESIRLLKSHFTKSGIIDEINHCFNVQQMSVNSVLDQKKDQKRYKSLSSLKDLLSLTSSSSNSKQAIYQSSGSLLSLNSLSSVSGSIKSHSTPSLRQSVMSRTSSSATSLSQSNPKDMSSLTCSSNNCTYFQQNLKLPENLICYLDVEDGQQVFAGPLLQWPKDVCETIFKKFAECCYAMSRQFRNSMNLCQEFGKTFQIKNSSNFLNPNKIKSKKCENDMNLFNVIGRRERNIEFYVCFKAIGCDLVPNDFDIEEFFYTFHLQKRLL